MNEVETREPSLSVLCAGIRGSSRLSRYLDKQEARYAVGRYENRIRRAVETHGGRLVERDGGQLMAFFADSSDALLSAIEMHNRVADLPPYAGLPLTVRVGVCTGHHAREARFFPSEGTNPAASLSEVANPEHILLSIPKRVKLSPWLPLVSDSVPDLSLSCGNRRLGVFQVPWDPDAPVALKTALAEMDKPVDRLRLSFNGAEIVLDDKQPALRIGRQPDCDIVLRDARCSRVHGTIERRPDHFVFVDCSSNGTFVTLEDKMEFFVHRKELLLFGHGKLSFGMPSAATGAQLLEFEASAYS